MSLTSLLPFTRVFRPPAAPSKWQTFAAVCLGLGMLMIDTFVVNVAFPAIGRDLGASLGAAEWTVSGYVLMVGVLPVAMGRLGDIFGRRLVYILGLFVFIVASAGCGSAQSIGALIAWRVLQGVGAATMMPGTLSIVTQAFPPRQRGLAIGLWGGVSGIGLIAGPILGGLLVRGDDWRWVFLVNLPVGLVALTLALRLIPESRDESAPRTVDLLGLALLSTALLLIMVGLTRANDAGWRSPLIVFCFAAGFALLPLFVAVERRMRHPLMDLSLFRSGTFVAACLTGFLFSATVFGMQPYLSLFMQNYWGFTPLQGGLAFLPATALVAALMPVSGLLGQRLGAHLRLIVIGGALSVVASSLLLLRLDTASGYVDSLLPAFVLRGLGIGLVLSAISLAAVSAVSLQRSGLASGTLTMARQVGTAMGVAVLGAVYRHHIDTARTRELASFDVAATDRVVAAAGRFVATGAGDVLPAAHQAVVTGFVQIALAGSMMCSVAALAALFIRYRPPRAEARPAPGPAAIEEPGRAPSATSPPRPA